MSGSIVPYGNRTIGFALNPDQMRRMARYRMLRAGFNRIKAKSARWSRGRTKTYTQYKRSTNSTGVLGGNDADAKLVYRKKRMPRRRRKRWSSFIKKVNAVGERTLGTRTVLFNHQVTLVQNVATEQGCCTFALYGFSSTRSWFNDLGTIGTLENTGDPTAAAGETIDQSSKVMFQSGILDLTIRNTSFFVSAVGPPVVTSSDAAGQLELDLYELYMRQDSKTNTVNGQHMSEVLNNFDVKETGGLGTGVQIQDRGASPWEVPNSLSRYGIKIIKKTKYFIPNGQTITYQSRDPRRHVCKYGDLVENDGFNRPGWTRIIYVIFKLTPGLAIGTGLNEYQARISVGVTRKYMYKVEGMNEDRERLITGTATPGNPT